MVAKGVIKLFERYSRQSNRHPEFRIRSDFAISVLVDSIIELLSRVFVIKQKKHTQSNIKNQTQQNIQKNGSN